jgi:hypothetical protein
VGVADVRRDLELMPARRRGEQAMNTIGRAFAKAPTAVIVDADLLRDPDDAMLAAFRDALEALPVELVPVPAGSPDPALYRLVPRPSPDEPER